MEFNQEFGRVFERLEKIPALQRKDWELNQSGVDRGLEAVLIQRSPREIATYALVQLRLAAMPELRTACRIRATSDGTPQHLLDWAETQKPKPSMLMKVIASATDATDDRRVAAVSVLKYYRRRDDENPAVKAPWTSAGLDKIPSMDVGGLLKHPAPDNRFWRGKYDTVQRLVATVLAMDLPKMSDDDVVNALQEIQGVGPQTASMEIGRASCRERV